MRSPEMLAALAVLLTAGGVVGYLMGGRRLSDTFVLAWSCYTWLLMAGFALAGEWAVGVMLLMGLIYPLWAVLVTARGLTLRRPWVYMAGGVVGWAMYALFLASPLAGGLALGAGISSLFWGAWEATNRARAQAVD